MQDDSRDRFLLTLSFDQEDVIDDLRRTNVSTPRYVGLVQEQFKIQDDFKVVESSDKIFNEAAIESFKGMPAWNPGKQRGKPVRVQLIIPVHFSLPSE